MKKTLTKTRTKIKIGTVVVVAIAVISVGGIMAMGAIRTVKNRVDNAKAGNCENYWFYYSNQSSPKCKERKFCGEFMSQYLRIFKSKSECEKSLDSKFDSKPIGCVDNCGNGICEKNVCQATGCPCAETEKSCAKDCAISGSDFSCTGSIPAGATKCAEDDMGLSSNLEWTIAGISSMGCTAKKCEYYNPKPAPGTCLSSCKTDNDCDSGYCYVISGPPSPPGVPPAIKGFCLNRICPKSTSCNCNS